MEEAIYKVCLFLSVMLLPVHCHLCLISPPQRGPLEGIDKKGSTTCFQVKEPCGTLPQEAPSVILRAGSKFKVTFQKNLDHYNKTSPGYFDVGMGEATKYHFLSKIKDNGEPSLTLYTREIVVPHPANGKSIAVMQLQVVYVTNNPNAPAKFYQCSDVIVLVQK